MIIVEVFSTLLLNTSIPATKTEPLFLIQIAILWNSQKNIKVFESEISNAMHDYQKTLTNTGLSSSNWKTTLFQRGIDLPEDSLKSEYSSIDKYECDLDEFISTYLCGVKENKGFDPLYGNKRIRKKFPFKWRSVDKIVSDFLKMFRYNNPVWITDDSRIHGERLHAFIENTYPFFEGFTMWNIVNSILYECR